MHIEHTLAFPGSTEQVAALFADPEFLRASCERMHAHNVEIAVVGSAAAGFTTTIRRTQSLDQIPQQLRRFAGSGLTIVQEESWQPPAADGSYVGDVSVDVLSTPVTFRGQTRLAPRTQQECDLTLSGLLVAKIPLLGGMVEVAAAPAIKGSMSSQLKAAREWLAR